MNLRFLNKIANKMRVIFVYPLVSLAFSFGFSAYGNSNVDFNVVLEEEQKSLATLSPSDFFKKFRIKNSEQKDLNEKMVHWRGVLLSEVVEKLLEPLTSDKKARIDLLRLGASDGSFVYMPRSLAIKYPILLGYKDLEGEKDKSLSLVLPVSTHPRIFQEGLFIDSYSLKAINSVQLTSYEERFKKFFLKRRTDPVALGGEKAFIIKCSGCHDPESKRTGSLSVSQAKRPLTKQEKKGIERYIQVFNDENPDAPLKLNFSTVSK